MECLDGILKKWVSRLDIKTGEIPDRIAHFSSYDTAYSILKNQEFHASSIMFMNDPVDSYFFFDEFVEILAEFLQKNGKNSKKYLDSTAGYIGSVEEFPDLWELILINLYLDLKLSRYLSESSELNSSGVFMLSFVSGDNFDDLNYWRSYGDNGRGVAIVLDGKEFINSILSSNVNKLSTEPDLIQGDENSGSFVSFYKCMYMNKKQVREVALNFMRDIMDIKLSSAQFQDACIMEIIGEIVGYISMISAAIKSDYYASEKEFRVVFDDRGLSFPLNLDFKRTANIIMPYKKIGWSVMSTIFLLAGPKIVGRARQSLNVFCWNIKKIHFPDIVNQEDAIKIILLMKSKVPYVDNY